MITQSPEKWDRIADVVVVGSGGAALAAATLAADGGAEVVIVEKTDLVGGTTAVSGGVMWVPLNHHMGETGLTDSREDALAYIQRLTMGTEHDSRLLEVFVDTAHKALEYLEANTPLQMTATALPDYYFPYDVPGKKTAGRAVEPVPYSFSAELPEWRERIVRRSMLEALSLYTTIDESMFGLADPEGLQATEAQRVAQDVRAKGAALIGRLFRGLLDRGVETLLATPARELVVVDGGVIGVRCEHGGDTVFIGARKGVVLACGGFEWNRELVRAFIGYDIYPVSPPNNAGDGLLMATEAAAELANMTSYWGQGAMLDPAVVRDGELVPQFDGGRGMPGSLIVNGHGVRFVNESSPYNDYPKAFGTFDPTSLEFPNKAPAWLIFDHPAKESTQIVSMKPGKPAPEWVAQAQTIAELAAQIGIDPQTLVATVDRFNENAAKNEDPDFRRHEVGIMAVAPLRPLDTPPFYAIASYPGALGTNGGPRLNADGQVRGAGGEPIPGLYAAGNTAANVFGWAYPSGGGTIVNGVTFGYLAGRHVAAQPTRELA